MNHYVYEITNLINSKKYIGKRSCECPIEEDKYMGSGKYIKIAIEKYGENNFKKENKMSSYRNKSILLCIITFLIGFMFLDFGKRDNSKEVENMKFSLESVEAQVYKKESEKSSLESQIENLKKNISNLESESSNLQNRLEELKNTKIQ